MENKTNIPLKVLLLAFAMLPDANTVEGPFYKLYVDPNKPSEIIGGHSVNNGMANFKSDEERFGNFKPILFIKKKIWGTKFYEWSLAYYHAE